MSAAGLRPGFGRGGMIHSLLVKIDGVGSVSGIGARGLFIVDEVTGTRFCGEAADIGDEVLETDMVERGREVFVVGEPLTILKHACVLRSARGLDSRTQWC